MSAKKDTMQKQLNTIFIDLTLDDDEEEFKKPEPPIIKNDRILSNFNNNMQKQQQNNNKILNNVKKPKQTENNFKGFLTINRSFPIMTKKLNSQIPKRISRRTTGKRQLNTDQIGVKKARSIVVENSIMEGVNKNDFLLSMTSKNPINCLVAEHRNQKQTNTTSADILEKIVNNL